MHIPFPHLFAIGRAFLHKLALPLLLVLFALCLSANAHAHRVNVFAFVDAGTIRVEASFGGGSRVKNGLVEVKDAATGTVYASTRTADDGTAAVEISREMREAKEGLHILLNAGEGHQNTWPISPEELGAGPTSATAPAPSTPSAAAVPASKSAAPAANAVQTNEAGVPQSERRGLALEMLSEEELARIIDARLEEKIAPLRHMLAESVASGPKLSEIVGGIGWLLGLFGVWALARHRS